MTTIVTNELDEAELGEFVHGSSPIWERRTTP
jgi:hypothetical protein